ncbi:hypothetical protein ABZW50_10445, partial [Streptomyces bacillaris]
VARAAAEMGDFLGAKFLVAFTQSGDTVKRLSRRSTYGRNPYTEKEISSRAAHNKIDISPIKCTIR